MSMFTAFHDRRTLLKAASGLVTCPIVGRVAAAAPPSPKKLAITIDDGPAIGPGDDLDAFISISGRIREAFVAEDVPAIMFVNEQQLHISGQRDDRVRVLEAWLRAGLDVGNHTYSHPNLRETDLAAYCDDIVKGEVISRPLMKQFDRQLVWFRYPFLETGDEHKAAAVERFLRDRNYRIAPISVDYADYSFAANYARAVRGGDTQRMAEIEAAVLRAAAAGFSKAESQSQSALGYQLPLILLIHCNELNAQTLPKMLSWMRSQGYEFVSLDQAMTDPAYNAADLPPGSLGKNFLSVLPRNPQ